MVNKMQRADIGKVLEAKKKVSVSDDQRNIREIGSFCFTFKPD